MARWDLHKGENREKTETVSFRVRLGLGVILTLTIILINHPNPNPYSPNPATNHSVSVLLGFLPLLASHLATTVRKGRDCGQLSRL